MTTLLLQAATAVVSSPAPTALSLGEWLALIAGAIAIAGVVYRTGVNSAETRHIKSMVESQLTGVVEKLEKIGEFIEESMRLRLAWADWRATTTADVTTARSEAKEAKEIAHKSRGVAQEILLKTEGFDRRISTLERLEEDRRVGAPDRRHHE